MEWIEFKPYMKEKLRELGGPDYDWVAWDLLKENMKGQPKKEALVDTYFGLESEKRRRKTWSEVYDEVNTIIFNLHCLGIRKGCMIATQLPTIIENYYASLFTSKLSVLYPYIPEGIGEEETKAILRHLAPDLTITVPSWHGREFARWHLEYQKENPNLKYVFVVNRPGEHVPEGTRPFAELLVPKIRVRYDDSFLDELKTDPWDMWELMSSGGTTALPKFTVDCARNWLQMVCKNWADGLTATRFDTIMCFGSLNGGTGRGQGVCVPLISGAKVIYLTEHSDEDALCLTKEERVTIWGGSPVISSRLVTHPDFEKYRTSLRAVISGGAPLPTGVAERLWEKGIKTCPIWGISEATVATYVSLPEDSKEDCIYTVGRPIQGHDYKIIDPAGNELPPGEMGEIIVWSPHYGVYKAQEINRMTFDENDYIHTGDIGVFNERGCLTIVGRKKDMILRGGQNIWPSEIEEILSKHSKVGQVAVVGMPDKIMGERVCVYAVPAKEETITLEEITAYLEARKVTKWKWPERLEVMSEMPMASAGGKVRKDDLRKDITEKLKREGKI